MSGICGYCEPSEGIPRDRIAPMLQVLGRGENFPQQVQKTHSAVLGCVPRWNEQQIAAHSNILIAVDGDLYNLPEIDRTLVQHGIDTQGLNLGERLIQLYLLQGPEFLLNLKGAFALAIWDQPKQRLLLAIDRFGLKSLYWAREQDALFFATRADAVKVARRQKAEVNPAAVLQYLLFSVVPAPLGIYRGISKMQAGTSLIFERGEVCEKAYWTMEYVEDGKRNLKYWVEEVRKEIRGAVHRQLEGCTPESTGAYLSGGTDSSSVVAFLSEKFRPAHTFSIFFSEGRYSEIEYARVAARSFGASYHERCLNPCDAAAAIPKIVSYYDEPFGNSSALGSYFCAQLARENGMDTLLAGDGGDELFAGNERYASDKHFSLYHQVPSWFRKALVEPIANLFPANGGLFSLPRKYIRRANIPNPLRIFSYGLFFSMPPSEIFEPRFLEEVPQDSWMSIADRHFHGPRVGSELNRMMHLDLKLILADNDLRKVNGTAELAGIRVRYPMLDQQLVQFSGRVPTRLKLKGFQKRYIFKQAMRGILPEAVLQKKKHGFGVPLGLWLLQEPVLKTLVQDVLADSRTRQRGYFPPAFYDRLLEWHRSDHAAYYGEVVWYLLALELWHRQHLETSNGADHAR
jgi:asparagine synthase (glutamine-hydrolysing)